MGNTKILTNQFPSRQIPTRMNRNAREDIKAAGRAEKCLFLWNMDAAGIGMRPWKDGIEDLPGGDILADSWSRKEEGG